MKDGMTDADVRLPMGDRKLALLQIMLEGIKKDTLPRMPDEDFEKYMAVITEMEADIQRTALRAGLPTLFLLGCSPEHLHHVVVDDFEALGKIVDAQAAEKLGEQGEGDSTL